jgi:membrane associated rhomboid family serine protease
VAPRTPWGKVITIIYALIGIPLMLVYFSQQATSWLAISGVSTAVYAVMVAVLGVATGATTQRIRPHQEARARFPDLRVT